MFSPDELGTDAPAVGTPTSWPSQLISARPLLPGLMAASVCNADTSSAEPLFSPGTCTVRSTALTMPEFTVPDRVAPSENRTSTDPPLAADAMT